MSSTRTISVLLAFTLTLAVAAPPAHAANYTQYGQRNGKTLKQKIFSPMGKKIMSIVGAGAILMSALGAGAAWKVVDVRNELVTKQEQVKASAADIQVEIQRRFDLIPNEVQAVKGSAQFEQGTLVKVAEARAAMMGATTVEGKIAALKDLKSSFIAVQEAYPQLKANANFQKLMLSLEQTENRITVARDGYNDAVAAYNTFLKTFPNSMFAGSTFKPAAFFSATPGAENAPTVDLSK